MPCRLELQNSKLQAKIKKRSNVIKELQNNKVSEKLLKAVNLFSCSLNSVTWNLSFSSGSIQEYFRQYGKSH
jgi:hypothetical protein